MKVSLYRLIFCQLLNRPKLMFFGLVFSAILSLNSCEYNVEEELYPPDECPSDNMSYSNDIEPILLDRCYICHDMATNTAGITIEGYDNLKVWIDNGRFLGAIKRQPGFSPMPKDQEALNDCQIGRIESWINDGAPNN